MKNILLRYSIFVFCVVGGVLFTACATDNNVMDTPDLADVSDNLDITLTTEAFGNTPTSRIMAHPQQAQTVDIGDGITAEISIEEDAVEDIQTRASLPLSDGKYCIYALDEDGNRITGALLKGEVKSGKFEKETGSALRLAPGTYTLVCYNTPAVSDDGSRLTVTTGNNALIGKKTITIGSEKQHVTFHMEHQTGRVRFRVIGYTEQVGNGKVMFTSGSSVQPKSITFNEDASSIFFTDQTTPYAEILATTDLPKTSNIYNKKYPKAHDFVTAYTYIIPGTDLNWCSVTTTATLYGKSISMDQVASSTAVNLARNSSYTISIKIRPEVIALFQDGSCGVYSEHGSRTAIGVVIDEKTNTNDGLAVALNNSGLDGSWNNDVTTQSNSLMITDFNTQLADMNGYGYTYEASGSFNGLAKADVVTASGQYQAFYAAINYDAGVPLTFSGGKTGKWFLPTLGQWNHMLQTFDRTTIPPPSFSLHFAEVNSTYSISAIRKVFEAVGGNGYLYDSVWFSSEYDTQRAVSFGTYDVSGDKQFYYYYVRPKTDNNLSVRPFINF